MERICVEYTRPLALQRAMPLCVSCALGRGWLGLGDVPEQAEAPVVVRPKVKRRWQWSRGDGPGEYGGPPASLDVGRPMWGKPIEDPLTTKDDYIWNKNWRPFMEEDSESDSIAIPTPQAAESDSGFLSFSRVMEIDRVDVDITKELLKPAKEITMEIDDSKPNVDNKKQWRYAPTRKERARWDRAKKSISTSATRERDEISAISAATQEKERYRQLKQNLQLLTVAIGGSGTAGAFVFYSPEVALSYGIGLVGAIAYVRMLGNSVDAFGRPDLKRAVSGAVGQPRLLVPVILTMVYNRWNQILVPEYGVAHVQLIPMLIGFFTYKIATIVQVVRDALPAPTYENDA